MKVVKETWKVDIYVSKDGRRFNNKSECERWEQDREDHCLLKEMRTTTINLPNVFHDLISSDWLFIKTKEDRDAVIRKLCNYAQWCYINGSCSGKPENIPLGDWVLLSYVDTEDGREQRGVYTLSYLVEQFKQFIDKVNEYTSQGIL